VVARPVRWAYLFIAPLALLIAFLGLGEIDQSSVPQAHAVVRADGRAGNAPNSEVARMLERTAATTSSTVLRIVADRSEPASRRTMLTTAASRSIGERWLTDGYPDFTRTMTTTVRPMSDLDRFDASGEYLVVGTDADARAVAATLTRARFDVSTTRLPDATAAVVRTGMDDTSGLVVLALVASAALCVIGTVGAPRRAIVRRVSGQRLSGHLGAELSGAAGASASALAVLVVVLIALAVYDGLAQVGQFLTAAASVWAVMSALVLAVHLVAATAAFRSPPARAIRGHRPGRAAVVVALGARFPAAVLLVVAMFDLVGSVAVLRDGGSDRDVRAAGDTVQLWVTGDPGGDVSSAGYWDAIGSFAAQALTSGGAFLSAPVEVPDGPRASVVAVFVSDGYLRDHPVQTVGGTVMDPGKGVQIAVPEHLERHRERIVRQIVDWNLKDAPAPMRAGVHTAVLDPGQSLYTHPGDAHAAAWTDEPVVVAVGSPAAAFSRDQLGAWLSTGDVVFTSEAAARRALHGSPVRSEISAVVAVGQAAAERSRRAVVEARIHLATWAGSFAVSVLVLVQGAAAHRRRCAQTLFGRFAAGWSPIAADRGLMVVEAAVLVLTLGTAFQLWWERRPDPSVFGTSLDPAAAASTTALAAAVGTALVVSCLGVTVMNRTRASVIAAQGGDR
jgi:hypothetical protein